MNKRITSIVLCLVLLVSLMTSAVPVSAETTLNFTVTADKTEANVGDTITYTVTVSAAENVVGIVYSLHIPEGLDFVEGSSSVPANLKSDKGFDEASFTEESMYFVGLATVSMVLEGETELMSFQCTVKEGATGSQTVVLEGSEGEIFDADYNDLAYTVNNATVTIGAGGSEDPDPTPVTELAFKVTADKATAKAGDTINYTVTVSEAENIVGIVYALTVPAGLDFVEGSSSVPANLKSDKGFDEASFTEESMYFVGLATVEMVLEGETELMSFQCTVKEGTVGAQTVTIVGSEEEIFDAEYNNVPFTVTGATVTVEETVCAHDWAAADCDTAKTCKVCGATEGAALGHNWAAADCDSPKTCKRCGATEGAALGHKWADATCFDPKTCEVCLETDGDPLEHDWTAADCDSPKTCKLCGGTQGAALGHDWEAADCDTAKTCKVCGATEGAALGHSWAEATCTAPKTCTVCGYTEGTASHDWAAADCDSPKTCKLCGATEGSALGHDWAAADCDSPKTCKVCGATEGSALGHDWAAADCDTAKTCKVCGATEGSALGHDWAAADCDTAKTCKVCGLTEGEPNGHDWADADCQNPKTCTACGATEGEKGDHVDNDGDGKCDVCGYEKTPVTGDESVMVFAVILMIAAVCGVVVVCNKKKFIV